MAEYVPIANLSGPSAYEVAVQNGFTGSEQDWLDSLKLNNVQWLNSVTDLDGLWEPNVTLFHQIRANNAVNGPSNIQGNNPLLNIETVCGAQNGSQRATTFEQTWWRFSNSSGGYYPWHEASKNTVVASFDGIPSLLEGEIGAHLDTRHSGIMLNADADLSGEFSSYSSTGASAGDAFNGFNVGNFFPAELGGHIAQSASGRLLMGWGRHGSFSDGEVLIRANVSGINTDVGIFGASGAILRANLSSGEGYYSGMGTTTVEGERVPCLVISRFTAPTEATSMRVVPLPGFDTDTSYNVRFRASGIRLMSKIWSFGDEEPTGWMAEVSDDTHTQGRAGFGRLSPNARPSRYNYLEVNRRVGGSSHAGD